MPGSSARPADILLPYWCRGRPAALDVSVISPLQRLTLADAASTQVHTLSVGVHRKLTSNLPACRAAGVDFFPIVVETLGGWCPDAVATICSIGRALGQRLNSTDPYDMTKHLFGRLAIALWRVNAGLWLHRHPSLPSTIEWRFNATQLLDLSTHFKSTNTFQYLHFSSSHPRSVFKGLVKGEAIRFLRSNTDAHTYYNTLRTFRNHLLNWKYPKYFVDEHLTT